MNGDSTFLQVESQGTPLYWIRRKVHGTKKVNTPATATPGLRQLNLILRRPNNVNRISISCFDACMVSGFVNESAL